MVWQSRCVIPRPMRATGENQDEPRDREECESVLWSEGERRCELWAVNGIGRLRLFALDTLLVDEPALSGALWAQAQALRTWTPHRDRRLVFGRRD